MALAVGSVVAGGTQVVPAVGSGVVGPGVAGLVGVGQVVGVADGSDDEVGVVAPVPDVLGAGAEGAGWVGVGSEVAVEPPVLPVWVGVGEEVDPPVLVVGGGLLGVEAPAPAVEGGGAAGPVGVDVAPPGVAVPGVVVVTTPLAVGRPAPEAAAAACAPLTSLGVVTAAATTVVVVVTAEMPGVLPPVLSAAAAACLAAALTRAWSLACARVAAFIGVPAKGWLSRLADAAARAPSGAVTAKPPPAYSCS